MSRNITLSTLLHASRTWLRRIYWTTPILIVELEDQHARHFGRSVLETIELLESWGYRSWIPAATPQGGVNYWFRRDA